MEDSNTDLRDASFSYLRAGEGFEHNNHSGSVHHHIPPLMSLGRSTTKSSDEEGEISVFGAERYFNMILDDNKKSINNRIGYHKKEIMINSSSSNNNQVHDLQRTRTRSSFGPGTPSSCSEVSWNSQKPLLPTLIRNPSESKKKKLNGKNIFAKFSCGGSCSDKKSIYVHEDQVRHGSGGVHVHVHDENKVKKEVLCQTDLVNAPPKPPQTRLLGAENDVVSNKEDQHFAFPILSSSGHVQASIDENSQLKEEEEEEEVERKSLEIFGTTTMKGDVVTINLERKLSMLTWDAIPKTQSVLTTPVSSTRMNDDIDSDASSDLFEIENLTVSTGFQPFYTRQVSDGMSSCMTPTSRYEPSEASIDWSVVTSSAAGGADYDEKRLSVNSRSSNYVAKTKAGLVDNMDQVMQRSKTSGLLGCKNRKAVRVAETAYRTKDHKAMIAGKVTKVNFF
ncbi:hypothetical protein FNV43_RR20465 [Rhamnella rubrinervis]|uniref:Uncharacterized protein n=1 Tax=Rhamnella rubrinervis TaxID=2594499 RepID=A0A8K0GTE7_9ROSA|nr:hypothetical protein FNV43_RR20465 [Rhamnella rubrinervis]